MHIQKAKDVEYLRQVATLLEAEVHRLLDVVHLKSEQIVRLRGEPGEVQRTLRLIEKNRERAKAQSESDGSSISTAENGSSGDSERAPRIA